MQSIWVCLGIALSEIAAAQSVETIVNNDMVRVLKVTVANGHHSGRHDHKINRVMIYLDPGQQILRYDAGPTTIRWKPNEAQWSPASGMHTADMTSPGPVTIVEVELKKPGGSKAPVAGPLDPVRNDPKHYKVEFENQQVRVIRARIGPGESTPLHEHTLPRIVTFLTPMKMEVTSADGRSQVVTRNARDVVWSPLAKHTEKNVSSEPMEVLAVELKGQ